VRKIKAVKRDNENLYSNEEYYWLNEDTGIVYEYTLNYPIGKVEKDENNQYVLLENDIYIIGEVINIPEVKLYD
jgi:hypothetical protein